MKHYCINKDLLRKYTYLWGFIIPCFIQMSNHRIGDRLPELPAVQHHRPAVLQPCRAEHHVCLPSHLQHLPASGGSFICGKWVEQGRYICRYGWQFCLYCLQKSDQTLVSKNIQAAEELGCSLTAVSSRTMVKVNDNKVCDKMLYSLYQNAFW